MYMRLKQFETEVSLANQHLPCIFLKLIYIFLMFANSSITEQNKVSETLDKNRKHDLVYLLNKQNINKRNLE